MKWFEKNFEQPKTKQIPLHSIQQWINIISVENQQQ